jgi:hypothetical protein
VPRDDGVDMMATNHSPNQLNQPLTLKSLSKNQRNQRNQKSPALNSNQRFNFAT